MSSSRPIAGRILAYTVHLLTTSGVVCAFLAARELTEESFDPRWVFLWLIGAAIIDSADGPLARRWKVGSNAPRIDGRRIDDIVDYLNYTFIPLLLVWRAEWLPDGLGAVVVVAMGCSLFGFANVDAKMEEAGLFLGFPSYWNVAAFYIGLFDAALGPAGAWVNLGIVVGLAILTLLPVRFVYPNVAPEPWKRLLLFGAAIWTGLLLWMLPMFPHPPAWATVLSLAYVVFYLFVSVLCDLKSRS